MLRVECVGWFDHPMHVVLQYTVQYDSSVEPGRVSSLIDSASLNSRSHRLFSIQILPIPVAPSIHIPISHPNEKTNIAAQPPPHTSRTRSGIVPVRGGPDSSGSVGADNKGHHSSLPLLPEHSRFMVSRYAPVPNLPMQQEKSLGIRAPPPTVCLSPSPREGRMSMQE